MDRLFAIAAYPAALVGAIAAFAALLDAGHAPAVAAFVPVAAAGLAILACERRFAARADWRPDARELAVDLTFMALVMVVLPRGLGAALVIAIAVPLHADPSAAWPHSWPLAAQVVLMILAVDFMRYWLHRACHRFGPMWRLHEVHHSPDRLHVANVGRFHPLEKALHFSLDTAPFLLLGVAPDVLAGYFLVYSVNGFFQHSNLRLRYGVLNYVVGSAETHRWHHARDPGEAACNFGSTTAVWDLAFGTWRLPGEVGDVGIADRRYPRGFLAQLAAPFRGAPGLLIALRLRLTRVTTGLRLARTLRDPMRVQRRLLERIVACNRASAFGRDHGFGGINGYDDFARVVPVSDFEALRPYIDAGIERGAAALTEEMPVRYVRTSGTTGRPKDIPLTPSHLAELRRIHRESVAFQHDACPEAFEGAILAFTSPASEGELPNGMPFGSASGIVAGDTPAAVREKFVLPSAVLAIEDSRVKYLLALRLALVRPDVTWMGAANATTILALMKLYREHRDALVADIRAGTFSLQAGVPAEAFEEIRPRLAADPERARELEALGAGARIAQLWPRLRLLVTWTCASAGVAARALREELSPRTRMMELGYIASEFRGTVTLGRRAGSGLPTFDTHFFEFVERERWDRGRPAFLTLEGLRKGVEYYVIVTTPSGLYRYFINDIVRVAGFLRATPLLEFVQKGKGVTNITGEKVCESQVLQATRECLEAMGRTARFLMMLADEEGRRYRLYVEPIGGPALDSATLAAAIDERLAHLNVEYRAKRGSDRLAPLEVRVLAPDTGEAYRHDCVRRGQREGQFKMVALDYRRTFPFDLDARAVA